MTARRRALVLTLAQCEVLKRLLATAPTVKADTSRAIEDVSPNDGSTP